MARPPLRGMIHLNNNILCAVSIETSGGRPGYDSLLELCILPLNSQLKLSKQVPPFWCLIRPQFPENLNFKKIKGRLKKITLNAMQNGIDPFAAADIFESWFEKLELPYQKKISPLSFSWAHYQPFLLNWLGGFANYDHFFDYRYRDVLTTALFLNDYADFHINNVPFSKVDLMYLASSLKLDTDRTRDTINQCVYIAEIYRRCMTDSLIHLPFYPSTVLDDPLENQSA